MARKIRRRAGPALLLPLILGGLVLFRLWQGGFSPPPPWPATGKDGFREGLYRVERVVDGDTLIVSHRIDVDDSGGRAPVPLRLRIRLLGIDTPETKKENTPVEPWGPEASAFTRKFVSGGEVTLRLDKRRVDQYGRHLAYVYVGERMLNEELVRAGLARVSIYPGDSYTIARKLRKAEDDARGAQRGIYSSRVP